MAIDLLSYRGDAGLGLSTNTNIPVPTEGLPTQGVNQFIRDAMAMDEQRNMLQWKQKINDRDNMMKLIAEDQFPAGDVLPEYMPDIEAAREAQIKAFDKWRGNPNDLKGFAEYKRASQKAKDTAKMAQVNTVAIRDIDKAAASEEIPDYKKEIIEFRDRQVKKGVDGDVQPFGKPLRLNVPAMSAAILNGSISDGTLKTPQELDTTQKTTITNTGGKIRETQTTTTAPAKGSKTQKVIPSVGMQSVGAPGISKSSDRFYDYDAMYGNAVQLYALEPKFREYQNLLVSSIPKMNPKIVEDHVAVMSKRATDYNTQRGLSPGQPGYSAPLEIGKDIVLNPQTGAYEVAIPTPEFAAKVTLASVDGDYFQPGQEVFDKEIAEFGLKSAESKAKIGALRALESQRRASAMLTGKRAKALDDQINPVKLWDNLFQGNIKNEKASGDNYVPRINANKMTTALRDALGIDPINSAGDYNVVPSSITFTNSKGQKIQKPEKEVWEAYKVWRQNDPKADEIRKGKNGEEPDVFDFLYGLPGVQFKYEVVGKEKPKKNKNGLVIDQGGGIGRSDAIQTWINQQMKIGRKGKTLSIDEEDITEEEE